jgi:hypothetical protein
MSDNPYQTLISGTISGVTNGGTAKKTLRS